MKTDIGSILTVLAGISGGIVIGIVIGIKVASKKQAYELKIDVNGDLSQYKEDDLINYRKQLEDNDQFEACVKIRDELNRRKLIFGSHK